jgi:dihydroorotate dehydrogenase
MSEFDGRIGHLEDIESPWGNAGGTVRTLEDVEAMAGTGVGWVEDGSKCLKKRLGHAVDPEHPELGPQFQVYTHDPETGLSGNSVGMPSPEIDVWEADIPEKVEIAEAYHKKYVQNVAPVSEDPAKESRELVRRAYAAGAHAVLLNAGCQNVITADGGRHELLSRNPQALAKVLVGLQATVEAYNRIFLRISPQESPVHAERIFRVIRASGVVSAVFTPNTWPGYAPTDETDQLLLQVPDGIGGKSGPGMRKEAALQSTWAVRLLAGSGIDVIRSSGIMNGQELGASMDRGAKGGAGTTFYYESQNGWQEDTDRLLHELAVSV